MPDRLRNLISGVNNTGILVFSPGFMISVFARNGAEGSCGGFVALPQQSLGRFYYVMTYGPPTESTQFGIVAVSEGTAVQIRLPDVDGLEVQYVI